MVIMRLVILNSLTGFLVLLLISGCEDHKKNDVVVKQKDISTHFCGYDRFGSLLYGAPDHNWVVLIASGIQSVDLQKKYGKPEPLPPLASRPARTGNLSPLPPGSSAIVVSWFRHGDPQLLAVQPALSLGDYKRLDVTLMVRGTDENTILGAWTAEPQRNELRVLLPKGVVLTYVLPKGMAERLIRPCCGDPREGIAWNLLSSLGGNEVILPSYLDKLTKTLRDVGALPSSPLRHERASGV